MDSVLNHMVGVGQKSDDPGRGSSGTASFDGRDGIESFPVSILLLSLFINTNMNCRQYPTAVQISMIQFVMEISRIQTIIIMPIMYDESLFFT